MSDSAPSALPHGAPERVQEGLRQIMERRPLAGHHQNLGRHARHELDIGADLPLDVLAVHLDPRDSEFGENAKSFENLPDEAKKLLDAAGFADGIDVPVYFVNSGQFGEIGLEEEQVVQNFAAEVGLDQRIFQPDPKFRCDIIVEPDKILKFGLKRLAGLGKSLFGLFFVAFQKIKQLESP